MAEFIAFDKSVEVNGQTILSVLDGMTGFESTAQSVLAKNGIDKVEPDNWYPQQAWLNAFKEIAIKIGSKTLISIGAAIPENAQWPPTVNSLESAMASVDVAYHMNHRKNGVPLFNPDTGQMTEGIGHYEFQKTGEKEITMICKNPYPCDFDKGIIKAVATKFKPLGAKLGFKENVSDSCRKNHTDHCTYIISW